MRAFVCLSACCLVACVSGCVGGPGYMMNQSGQTFYEQGNYTQATLEFQRAVAANPGNADYIGNLAAALKKQGNLETAEHTFRHALNLNPSHQPSYHGLSQLLVETNRHNEAAQLLGTWSASQPYSAEAQLEMAWLNRELGNEQVAAQHLQQALQINPNNSTALASLGEYYEQAGQAGPAAQLYQLSLQNDWYQPEVQSRLASLKGLAAPTGMNNVTQVAQAPYPGASVIAGPMVPGVAARTAFRPGGVSFPPTPGFIADRRGRQGRDYLFPQLSALPPLPQQPGRGLATGAVQTQLGMVNPGFQNGASANIVSEAPAVDVYGNIAMAPVGSGFIGESADGFVSGELATPITEYAANGEWVSEQYMPSPFTDSAPGPTSTQESVPAPEPEYQLPPPSTPITRTVPPAQYPPSPGPAGSVPLTGSAPQVTSSQDALEAF